MGLFPRGNLDYVDDAWFIGYFFTQKRRLIFPLNLSDITNILYRDA